MLHISGSSTSEGRPTAVKNGAGEGGLTWIMQLDVVRVLRSGWRYPAVVGVLALTMAGLYLAGQKRMYQASARLLVLQQGGPPLSAGESGRMLGGEDYLPTHAAILKSPLVVGRAIETVGIANLPTLGAAHNRSGRSLVTEAIEEMTVSRPDRAAKIVCIDYRAGSKEEAVRMVTALLASYDKFLEDKFHKSNGDIISLVASARDKLRDELVQMQTKYLEFRKTHAVSSTDETGRSFLSRRLDQWDRAANEAMVKEVQLSSQLELGRKLAGDGVGFWAVIHAMNQLGGGDPGLLAHATEPVQGGSSDFVRQLGREQQEMAEKFGPHYTKVRDIHDQINRIQERARETRGRIDRSEVKDLLGSLEQSLTTIRTMRAEMANRFEKDMVRAKQVEDDLLAEADLKGNIEQLRSLFNTTVEQLKKTQLVGDYNGINAQVIEPANSLPSPVRPRVGLTLALALLCGLTAGAAAALVADRMDLRIRSLDALRDVFEMPTIGRIPVIEDGADAGPLGQIARSAFTSVQVEAYREVRNNIEMLRRKKDIKTILVTSPHRGDGKSTVVSNLAILLAQAGRSVLLIDADLRLPTQDKVHGQSRNRGLSQILQGNLPLHLAIKPSSIANLDLIVAGPAVTNPSELLMSPRFAEILEFARQSYDLILIDSSPMLAVADATILGSLVDGIVLVASPSTLWKRDAERAKGILKGLGTPVLGIVANRIDAQLGQLGYGYGYGYGYGNHVVPGREEAATPCLVSSPEYRANGAPDHVADGPEPTDSTG